MSRFVGLILTVVVLTPSAFGAERAGAAGGPLRLADAVTRALSARPETRALRSGVDAAAGRAVQAGVRPNPEAALVVEDVFGTGDFESGGQAQTTIELRQLVELGGKRRARARAASAAVEAAARELGATRLDVASDVAERFVALLAAQELREIARENASLFGETLRTIRERRRAGAASELEDVKGSIAVARAELDEEHAEHELATARKALAVSIGTNVVDFARADGNLFERTTIGSYEDIEARIAGSPVVARSRAEGRVRAGELEIAQSKAIPNATLSGGVRRLEARDAEALVFGASVPLVVFDRNAGGIAEAEASMRRATAETEAITLRLHAILFELHLELRHAALWLDRLDGTVLADADRALAAARRGYDLGTYSYLDLADAGRTSNELRKERVEAAATFHRLRFEIARLLGGPLGSDLAGGTL